MHVTDTDAHDARAHDSHAGADPAAPYPDPCSCRLVTARMPRSASGRYSSRLCVPGMPKTAVTP